MPLFTRPWGSRAERAEPDDRPARAPAWTDLHVHYVPAIDDGVKTTEQGMALCAALHEIGFATVVATPHIRAGMFDNRRSTLAQPFADFVKALRAERPGPRVGLGAEHFFDEHFLALLAAGEVQPYPGGRAILLELHPEVAPLRLVDACFRLRLQGLRPVIAHPERYRYFFKDHALLEELVRVEAAPLLDLMALVGHYGRRPQKTAWRLLENGLYFAACSDAHRPQDVPKVAQAVRKLRAAVGEAAVEVLLAQHPQSLLAGADEEAHCLR